MMARMLFLLLLFVTTATNGQTSKRPDKRADGNIATMQLSATPDDIAYTKNSFLYNVRPVAFNTSAMDFSPYPYGNGIVFVSSRTQKGSGSDGEAFLSLFYTEEAEDGSFSIPERLHEGSITSYHEGPAVFFNEDNKKILSRNSLIKKSKMKDGSAHPLELAHSERTPSGHWTEPVTLPFASPEYSVAHPAISSDGTTLYFSSNMPGSIGDSDIFISKLDNGAWSAPRNLGAKINTPGKELFPFLYQDSILLFASDGHAGLGGLDIFSFNLKTPDAVVSNFGSPVNTDSDDFGIFLEAEGSSGFFSSNRPGGSGSDDLYYFELRQPFVEIQVYDSLSRRPINHARIILESGGQWSRQTQTDFNGKTECRLNPFRKYQITIAAQGYLPAEIEMIPSPQQENQEAIRVHLMPLKNTIHSTLSSALKTRSRRGLSNTVTFDSRPLDVDLEQETTRQPHDTLRAAPPDSVSLPMINVFAAEVINELPAVILAKGDSLFEFTSQGESLILQGDLELQLNIPRGAKRNDYEKILSEQIVSQGYAISRFLLIRSFFFDTGKTWVRNDASAQLDKIAELMHAYPQMDLQMTFHSDSRGTDEFNLRLSKARSLEVTEYLLMAGIEKERIHSSYVGESQPLKDCGDLSDCDELFHQMNRTVEFKFIIRGY
ncbi:MAG: OmpA family protein [Chryseosolibacter sp.]